MVLKLSLAAAVLTALLGAFLVVRTSDEAMVRGATVAMIVWDIGDELSREQVQEEIAGTAAREGLSLYRSIDSVTPSGRATRTLTVINPGTDQGLPGLAEPYPSFGRSLETRFGPLAAGSSPTGTYVSSGSAQAADELATTLRDRGVTVSTRRVSPAALALFTAEVVPLAPLALAAVLSLVLGCVHSTVGFRRRDTIREVHGMTRGRIVVGHAARCLATTFLFGAIGLVASVPALAAYNGLAQFGRFAVTAGVAVGAVAVTAAMVVLLTAARRSRVQNAEAIAGRRPLRRLAVFAGATHAVALGLVLIVLASATASGLPALQNRADDSSWSSAEDFTSLTFRISNTELDRDTAAFADIGRHVIAQPRDGLIVAGSEGEPEGYGPEVGNSLIVNTRYLDEQEVLGRGGRRVLPSDLRPQALTLLISEGIPVEVDTLVRQYQRWILFQAELPGREVHPERIPIDYQVVPAGQSLFTYATSEPTSRQLSPVVAILPTSNPLLSDDWITSNMTRGGVLFGNSSWLRTGLSDAELGSSVLLNRVGDLAALRLADQERTLRASAFSGALAALVALLAAALLATSIAERNRRRDFLRHVHGYGFATTALAPIAVVAASNTAVLALATTAQLFESPLAQALANAVVAADLVVVGVLLAFQRRRFRTDTITNS
ncbi:hypothetical protein AS850_13145 [Frondihabitans sp. 762G35]|uniref:hypothetical protein n=1 Tax=Frondihabitans sp. 762G35 TaxID=1446794 RepID=UPI000D225EAA|nr:hypothetical protein [Frondihabitans sp. 762G35]ARC58024.1 hypothetical protein AS850_13145 [Frondihabitans sp. 762G35]